MRQGESVLQRRIALSEMLDSESFTEVVKGFVELYRIGIKVFDEKGAKLVDIKVGNGDFCGYVFSFPVGRQRLRHRRDAAPPEQGSGQHEGSGRHGDNVTSTSRRPKSSPDRRIPIAREHW